MRLEKKRGQALVEFVIVLPIFIFMLFACIDFGKILYTQNNLESKMDDVITIYAEETKSSAIEETLKLTKEETILDIQEEEKYLYFSLKKEVQIITPGLNLILKNPYIATVKRVIYNE